MKINKNLNKIQISTIRKISQQTLKYTGQNKLINLTIGEPDLEVPEIIKKEMINYIKTNKLGYPQLGGILELRSELVNYYLKKYSIQLTPEEIIVTVGSTEALSIIIKAIILEGDEVIAPLPLYPGYEPLITLQGGKMIKIDTSHSGFQLTVDSLKKFISNKTKAIILNYPSNPTGIILDEKNRKEILEFAKQNNIYIISDEVYAEIVFNKTFQTLLDKNYRDNVIIINGFSKSHSLTGMRIGYLICNKELRAELLKIHQYSVTSPSIISEYAAITALKKCSNLEERKQIYENRATFVIKKLQEIGFEVIKPDGGIYVFASYSNLINEDSLTFALELLEIEGVALVPGIAFGLENYIRISLIQNEDILLEAINRIKNFIKNKLGGKRD